MLSGPELRAELESGRLAVDPPISDADNLGVAIELTLHNVFWRSTLPAIADVEVVVGLNADPYAFMHEETMDELLLEPQEFVLAETAEALQVPLDLCGWIEGKSGRARLGLGVHLTAPKIDPGWGRPRPKRITLEIVNHNHVKVRLRAGAPIAQVVFHRLGIPASEPYAGRHLTKGTAS
jgi:dCTP deaminase